jgi:hypothetical protein
MSLRHRAGWCSENIPIPLLPSKLEAEASVEGLSPKGVYE